MNLNITETNKVYLQSIMRNVNVNLKKWNEKIRYLLKISYYDSVT